MEERTVYEQIRARILEGKYKGGAVLAESGIADELGVSRTPVRLALIKLEAVGLVRIVPRRGIYVTELTLQRFMELFEVRRCLIQLSGQLAADRISSEGLRELSLIVGEARVAKEDNDRVRLQNLDKQFHELLEQSTGNTVLAETLQTLRDQMIRIWTLVLVNSEYFARLPGEMEAVLGALQARDRRRCEELLSAHIDRYREYINRRSD